MVDSKVLIGVPTGEYSRRADFYDYYNVLDKPNGCMAMFSHDRSPAHGRNTIIDHALEHECTHILFIDDDMAFKKDALLQLLVHNLDIVSGLYLSRAYPHQPIVFGHATETGRCLAIELDNDERPLREVVATGFGFLLVKTSIFKNLEKPYIRLGELDPQEWCDDLGFFHRVREAGIKSYCDMTCLVGHIGSMIIWPNKQDGKWFTGYDTGSRMGMINTPQIITDSEVFVK
jgi:glycosyltransferase involved in cell wall biosynthesis